MKFQHWVKAIWTVIWTASVGWGWMWLVFNLPYPINLIVALAPAVAFLLWVIALGNSKAEKGLK